MNARRPSLTLCYCTFLGVLTLTPGCAVGPNHKAPEVVAPKTHRGDEKPNDRSFAELPWWEIYKDPSLFELIRGATQNSFDLRVAMARVEMARQAHRAAVWSLWPTVGVQGGVGDAVGSLTVPNIYPPQATSGHFGVGAGASWEADVWGRLRRLTSAAKHEFQAADEDRRGVYIALVGDIAELYFSLLTIDLQSNYARRAIETRSATLTLFEQRASGGVGNDLEVSRARASLKQVEAALNNIILNEKLTEHSISYLLARMPQAITRGAALDSLTFLPEVPAGLPSTLLKRRPDILAAEKLLLAQNDRIGAEMADFFPKFELTGFLGIASPNLKEASFVRGGLGLFKWTLPFLGGERERAEYDAAKAAWEGSVAHYERTTANAFREVADALFTISALRDRRAALDEQVAALEEAERHAVDRYSGGVANYLDVLTAQEQLLSSQLEVAQVMGRQHAAVSSLYRALGGGWPLNDDKEENKRKK